MVTVWSPQLVCADWKKFASLAGARPGPTTEKTVTVARKPREDADDFNRRLRRAAILTWAARALMALGVVIAGQHLLAHAGYRPIPMTMGAQDLLVGYPTAMIVAVVGLVIWGRSPAR